MYKSVFFDCLRRKAEEFEPEFMKQLEKGQGWASQKPQKTGFYYVRPVVQPKAVELSYYLIEEGHPYESNTIMNNIRPEGDLEFLGPFGMGLFVAWQARVDFDRACRQEASSKFSTLLQADVADRVASAGIKAALRCLDKGLESVTCSGDPDYYKKEVQWLGIDLAKEDEKLVVLEEGKVSFFRCKYCETPIFVGEAFSSDGKTYWHKECDGEVSCDCSEEPSGLFDDSVKVKAVINIPAQTRTIEFSMSRSSVGVFDSPESQAEYIYLGDLLTSKDFSVESFEIQEADDE